MDWQKQFYYEIKELYQKYDFSGLYIKTTDGYEFSKYGAMIVEHGRILLKLIRKAREEGLISLADHQTDDSSIQFFIYHITTGTNPEHYTELGFLRYASHIIPTGCPELMLDYLFILCAFHSIGTCCNVSDFSEYASAILDDVIADMIFTEEKIILFSKEERK